MLKPLTTLTLREEYDYLREILEGNSIQDATAIVAIRN